MSAAEELDEIAAAQRALDAAQKREAARAAAQEPPLTTLGEALAGFFSPAGAYPCNGRCGQMLERPGLCDECARRSAAQALGVRTKSWLRTIPARQRDVTWATLPKLQADRGGPRVRGDVRAMRAGLDRSDRGAVIGPAGSGKTTIAVAWLRAELERDPGGRVRFVSSADLLRPEVGEDGGPHPLALALSADVLVLDDIGAELEGAAPGSGLLAQRVGPASRVIAERYERGRRTVVTSGFDAAQVASLYGDRVARRMFEAAAVIRLGGAS